MNRHEVAISESVGVEELVADAQPCLNEQNVSPSTRVCTFPTLI